ncbi:uroporphyrinogen-III synthase [Undibacterium jejuense]|uniref:Uroporphyrinogen-III synthase n=1 Tax=Undibacterium jejuense TaxID=1344949 RepID=A0A923HI39_9BURK|nr:uroporphyrinogen-III synthase [Undibacterium jejuense]MBC3864144.1 uroporphyrinogen-III synthase [Undibacterium jejuense]
MQAKKVIITRPLAQARDFAVKVNQIGRESVLFPLIDIHGLSDQTLIRKAVRELAEFALVVFVSPNAIDAFFQHVITWPIDVPIAVMGAGSRLALSKHGLTEQNASIISPANRLKTDSETLLEVLDVASLAGKKVLIVRGTDGRDFLSDALRSFGAEVILLSAYQRCAPEFDDQKKVQLIHLLEVDHQWVVTSSEALRTLMNWCVQLEISKIVAKLQHQTIIVPHARIAEVAQQMGFHFITLTASGDENVLVALQSHV